MSGEIRFNIHFRYCKEHGSFDEPLVSLVNRICPAGRNFDSKVMVAIGILRWLFDFQREEIGTILLSRGLHISTGEISNLSEEFLLRFYALHKRHIPQMKALFEKRGGVRLHLDGTGEAGNEIVFMAKEGETGITMDAQIIPTESKKYVKAFLQALNSLYNQGKLIFKEKYAAFRKSIVEMRILSQLKKMKEDMETTLTDINKEGEASGGELLQAARQITKNCRKHANELFVEVKDNSGNVVEIMRDNNIEERSHRWSRMHIRRRTGRTRTTNEMAQYGALTAIFSNLENETYVNDILSDVKDFIRELQDITPEEIHRSRELIRPYVRKELIHSDSKRTNLLKEFINLLEEGYSVESGLTKLNFSNPIMTP